MCFGGEVFTREQFEPWFRGTCTAEIDASDEARTREWAPHEAFLMSVCETDADRRVVEITALDAAGFETAFAA